MAKPVWQKKLQERIALNPLYFLGDMTTVVCMNCGGKAKGNHKVPFYRITNYNEFRKCAVCGIEYR